MTGIAPRRALWLLLWAGPVGAQEAVTLDVDVDHLILGVSNLSRGIDAFSALTGVVPRYGGKHPGRGTENALVSLGAGRYIELLAPVSTAPDSGRPPAAGSEPPKLTLSGWALHTRALDQLITVVRSDGFQVAGPIPGSRRTPEGTLLQWRTASVSGPGLESAPFFIEWGSGTAHPSSTSPAGCRLVSFELVVADPSRLQQLFRAVGYKAVVRAGSSRAMHLTLDCPRGRVTFTT